jgi:hypothetical protein
MPASYALCLMPVSYVLVVSYAGLICLMAYAGLLCRMPYACLAGLLGLKPNTIIISFGRRVPCPGIRATHIYIPIYIYIYIYTYIHTNIINIYVYMCVSIRMCVCVRGLLRYGCVCVRCMLQYGCVCVACCSTDVVVCDAYVASCQGAELLDTHVYKLVYILTNLLSPDTQTHRISLFFFWQALERLSCIE